MAIRSAENYRGLRRRGITVRKTIDCLIATFVIAHGFALLHNDRDFAPFEQHLGLTVVRASAAQASAAISSSSCYNADMGDNIIHSFQQRRQLTQALDDLANSTNEPDLLARVRALVHTYPSDLLTTMLVKTLETANSQIRGGLGHLASLLPPEEIVPALRSAAANRSNSPQMCATAALILERFLGETLPPALLADLNQTNEVAFQSLREAVAEGALNRHVLLEYVTQMRQTPESIAFLVLDSIGAARRDRPHPTAAAYRPR